MLFLFIFFSIFFSNLTAMQVTLLEKVDTQEYNTFNTSYYSLELQKLLFLTYAINKKSDKTKNLKELYLKCPTNFNIEITQFLALSYSKKRLDSESFVVDITNLSTNFLDNGPYISPLK